MPFTLDEAFDRIDMSLYQHSLLDCYSQPHRHYHNIDHIKEMLKHVPVDHVEAEIVLTAILFHDLIYLPYPSSPGLNESLSVAEYIFYDAKAIVFEIPFGKNPGDVEFERRVIEAITATSRHLDDQPYLGKASRLVLDLDLSTFSLPRNDYLVWRDRIEKENIEIYGKTVSPHDIQKGRYQFLDQLSKRKQLYYLKTEWESLARQNLEQDLIDLEYLMNKKS